MTTATKTAKTASPARRFGAGILATHPVHFVPYTASEAAWWAAESARLEDARFDAMAAESAAMDLMEAGLRTA